MSKFKVGDKVRRINSGAGILVSVGEVGEITEIDEIYDMYYMKGYRHSPDNIELAWGPVNGERVYGRDDDNDEWLKCVFIGMDETAFICRDTDDDSYLSWEQVKEHKTHTITLEDGTKVGLSEESYKALQDSVK